MPAAKRVTKATVARFATRQSQHALWLTATLRESGWRDMPAGHREEKLREAVLIAERIVQDAADVATWVRAYALQEGAYDR